MNWRGGTVEGGQAGERGSRDFGSSRSFMTASCVFETVTLTSPKMRPDDVLLRALIVERKSGHSEQTRSIARTFSPSVFGVSVRSAYLEPRRQGWKDLG